MVTDNLLEKLDKISSEMSAHNDQIHAQKLNELNSKLAAGRLTIALCGHFSAGKSTLLNTLCGARLLPSSPIPTSANVVTIAYGEESKAVVEVSSNGELRYDEVAIDQLDAYCKDGELYVSVQLQYPSPLLKSGVVLLDTPGIDSTDAAHKLATESALHMADVVFYVMDYNHVQSEINFSFAKELREWGKPLYFIVNQIDKHREEELSFEQYEQSVYDAFLAWHLEPAGIIYLSLRQPDHPHHQWESLLQLIADLQKQQEKLTKYSVWSSLEHMTQSFLAEQLAAIEPQKERLLQQIGGLEALHSLEQEQLQTQKSIEQLSEQIEQYPVVLRKEVEGLLDNANITPAALRDLAQLFLETRKPGFRAGLLASKQKTAAVQAERLQAFFVELAKLCEAAIQWHLNGLLRRAAEEIGYDREQLEILLQQLVQAAPTEQLLLDSINPGAVFGNEYTMTYSKDLAAAIKGRYRRAALSIIDDLWQHARTAQEKQLAQLQAEHAQNAEKLKFTQHYRQLEQEHERYAAQLQQWLLPKQPMPELPEPAKLQEGVSDGISFVEQKQQINLSALSEAEARQAAAKPAGEQLNREQLVSALEQSSLLLAGIEGMEQMVEELQEKARRLENRSFTISLFGAFSAGKSSLANALIGERLLPVSPNPTTAAINSLLPPDAEHAHDTATIYMKPHELMLDDISYSLKLLGYDLSEQQSQDQAYLFKLIDAIKPESIHSSGRAHYSFVKAARQGWEEQQAWLGKQRTVDRQLYQAYVAEEQRSCFVSEIKYYYDCSLTRAGIVLVDTPGADSVNARHTGVAFNYIKSTDAILFVTYYNHAFSHADSQFLDQLGRVKDQFELDKMFFIVNAADLASDQQELLGVLEHVELNLNRHGIIKPRMFPISSLNALEGKLGGDEQLQEASGIVSFERVFQSFIHDELGALAMQSAQQELSRAANVVVRLLEGARTAKQDAAGQKARIEANLAQLAAQLNKESAQSLPGLMKQEIEELMYYIVQRIGFRFGDFYHYAFNPAVLKEDGRALSQAAWTSWRELERSLALELQQELLATTLRVERALDQEIQKQVQAVAVEAASQLAGYQAPNAQKAELKQPNQPADWKQEDVTQKWLSGRIKSPKQFFEGDGKTKLRAELEAFIFPNMEQWMKQVQASWQQHYEQQWQFALSAQLQRLAQSIEQYGTQQIRLLEDESYVSKLEAVNAEMQQLQSIH